MPQQSGVSAVFRALADPTRCEVVRRLGSGPASMTELAAPFGMALPSFAQHMLVLERCGVVRSHKAGRARIYRLDPSPLRLAQGWLAEQRAQWEARLDRLDAFVLAEEER
jgi:DNA-binding transcriptional ArsR family regulator